MKQTVTKGAAEKNGKTEEVKKNRNEEDTIKNEKTEGPINKKKKKEDDANKRPAFKNPLTAYGVNLEGEKATR